MALPVVLLVLFGLWTLVQGRSSSAFLRFRTGGRLLETLFLVWVVLVLGVTVWVAQVHNPGPVEATIRGEVSATVSNCSVDCDLRSRTRLTITRMGGANYPQLHPFTGTDGTFRLKLETGRYTLTASHRAKSSAVTVE
jgi:hypothetical protein